ncbi:MAG: thiG [Rickettsiales bacterium]|jgi:thiazole synthase|nr:thiG [Rickettsiales bacterium]
MTISLSINGEKRTFEGPLTAENLLVTLALDTKKVAFERNLAIVPKSAYADTLLSDGDRIEIVHFIGGG